jgi:tryptophanyl-tRNA synthetase
MNSTEKQRVFSGVQPTGALHIGNYLGAIRNFVGFQDDYDALFSIVDLHAITVWQDPHLLRESVLDVAAAYIASGIDPNKATMFVQSEVSGHAELAWILNCVARIGWLNRMTQFKEKAGKRKENASVGLYVYPNLMAADILLYRTHLVPVGDDQKQHLEITRDIAQKFNSDFANDSEEGFFPLPEPLILPVAARVMSLRDGLKKMSKSDPSDMSRLGMLDSNNDIAKKIKKAKTDPDALPDTVDGLDTRPEAKNLVSIYSGLANNSIEQTIEDVAGWEFSKLKEELIELAVETIGPIRDETLRVRSDVALLKKVLSTGREKAAEKADLNLADIKRLVGFA